MFQFLGSIQQLDDQKGQNFRNIIESVSSVNCTIISMKINFKKKFLDLNDPTDFTKGFFVNQV